MTERPDTRTPDRAATSPRTEAGRAALARICHPNGATHGGVSAEAVILAIEAEATQEAPASEGLRLDLANCEPWTDATGAVVGQKVPEWLMLRLLAAAPPTLAEPPRPQLPEDACGVLGLCDLPKRHEGSHQTSVDRVLGAEARPPEGLDVDLLYTAILAELVELWGEPSDAVSVQVRPIVARNVADRYARLSAGGADQ